MAAELVVDQETGERLIFLPNNAETGEPEAQLIRRKVPFQIPKSFQKDISSKKKKIELSKPVPEGTVFGETNPIFLFLTAIIYFRWFVVGLCVFEALFHVWAHRKNKSLKDAKVYYRSPFHSISSEYCAICQNEIRMNRIDKMQQARMHRFLRQCSYMKRVVT